MGIRFCCHHCDKELHVKDFQGGKKGRCPKCEGKFRVPMADAPHSLPVEQLAVTVGSGNAPKDAEETARIQPKESEEEQTQPVSARSSDSVFEDPSHFEALEPDSSLANSADDDSRNKSHGAVADVDANVPASDPTAVGESAASGVSALDAPHTSEPAQPAGVAAAGPEPGETANAQAVPTKNVHALGENGQANWYVRLAEGEQFGPAEPSLVYEWLEEDRVPPSALVWCEGWADWRSARDVFDDFYQQRHVAKQETAVPPSVPPPPPPAGGGSSRELSSSVNMAATTQVAAGATNLEQPSRAQKQRQDKQLKRKRNYTLAVAALAVLSVVMVTALVFVLMYRT